MEADVDYGSEVLKSLCPTSDIARTGAFTAELNNINTISKESPEISENSSELNHANLAVGLLERHTSIQGISFRIYFGLRLINAIEC